MKVAFERDSMLLLRKQDIFYAKDLLENGYDKTNYVSFSCVCPVIDHKLRYNIVKVAVAEWIRRLL